MKHSTPTSMKFKKLKRRLGLPAYAVAGLLELLWVTTANNARRGDIGQFSNEEIAIELDWEGDPDELVGALVACGWLDESGEFRLIIHDWQDHCPGFISAWIKRQGVSFASNRHPTREATSDGTREATSDGTREATSDGTRDGSLDPPYQTQPNQTKPNQTNSCSEVNSEPQPESADELTDFVFDTVGKGAKTWTLTVRALDGFIADFPGIDVMAEIRAARSWCRSNPRQRKTAAGMPRFLNGWLSKAQNRSRGSPSAASESVDDLLDKLSGGDT